MPVPPRYMIRVVASLALVASIAALPAAGLCRPFPIPLSDRKYDPPLTDISSLNSDSRLLAVQAAPGGGAPARVLAIAKDGKAATLDELGDMAELAVPAERLWIAGHGPPALGGAPGMLSVRLPVTGVQVVLSAGGETYTVIHRTEGAYYELRHKDKRGKLLFIMTPRDGYGLKAVRVSGDGSRVLVVDESPLAGGVDGGIGQRLYLYDKSGRLLSDSEVGDDPELWLDASECLMADDGSYFVCTRGRGGKRGTSVVLFDGDGTIAWEGSYFREHRLTEDFGGVFGLKGGSKSFLGFLDKKGGLMMVERAGYGFDLWLSKGRKYAYVITFRPFDLARSGVAERIAESFPGAKVVGVDIGSLAPGADRPDIAIAPDGGAFIIGFVDRNSGLASTKLSYLDPGLKVIWEEEINGEGVSARFVDGHRGFILRYGKPVTRILYYELRDR